VQILLFYLVVTPVRETAKSDTEVVSVRPSACLHGTTRHTLDGFSWNFVWLFF